MLQPSIVIGEEVEVLVAVEAIEVTEATGATEVIGETEATEVIEETGVIEVTIGQIGSIVATEEIGAEGAVPEMTEEAEQEEEADQVIGFVQIVVIITFPIGLNVIDVKHQNQLEQAQATTMDLVNPMAVVAAETGQDTAVAGEEETAVEEEGEAIEIGIEIETAIRMEVGLQDPGVVVIGARSHIRFLYRFVAPHSIRSEKDILASNLMAIVGCVAASAHIRHRSKCTNVYTGSFVPPDLHNSEVVESSFEKKITMVRTQKKSSVLYKYTYIDLLFHAKISTTLINNDE